MKRVGLVHIGIGTVGGALLEQVVEHRDRWQRDFGLDVAVVAFAGTSGARIASGPAGISRDDIRAMVHERRSGLAMSGADASVEDAIAAATAQGPAIVLDAAAGDQTCDALVQVLEAGGGAVLSNKSPMALPSSDPRTARLWREAVTAGRLRYEATCGAGLPVVSTLLSLLDTGDDVLEISGTLSGTFGAIFSQVGNGVAFSQAVREARAQGYTEPDPRDDLSGLDVARKGLILARTLGHTIDLDDIEVHSLVPKSLEDVDVDEFLRRIADHDADVEQQAREARANGTSLKYLVDWTSAKGVTVGLRQVPRSTVIGALQGPENIVSFRTQRYDRYPCVVSGPGAGAAVTAAGMAADMLSLARQLTA